MAQSIPETHLSKKRKGNQNFARVGLASGGVNSSICLFRKIQQTKQKMKFSVSDLRKARTQDQSTELLNRVIIHGISVCKIQPLYV